MRRLVELTGLSLLLGLFSVACRAGTPETDGPSAAETRPSVEPTSTVDDAAGWEPDPALPSPLLVEQLSLIADDTVEVTVARPCGVRRVESMETDSEVALRFLDFWDPAPNEGCAGELALETEVVVLDRPLGDRTLVLEVPHYTFDERSWNDPCFVRSPSSVCRELVIQHDGERLTIDEWPIGQRPITLDALDLSPIELSNGWTLDLQAPLWPAEPIVVNTRSIFQPAEGINGSVVVHNVDRDLSTLTPTDAVAGFPAYSIKGAGEADGPIRGVTIDTGLWLIDIVVFANPPERHPELLAQLLSDLEIETRGEQIPLVADRADWIRDSTELIVTDLDQRGFTISFAPNCEIATNSCRPGLGYVGQGGGFESSVSEVPNARWSPLAVQSADFDPDSLSVAQVVASVSSFGDRYPLLECDGIPWYDPTLQPKGMTLADVDYENWQQSGIRDWTWRDRPGEVSGHTGPANNPEAVVRFAQRDDGLWDVVSATRCA